MVEVHIQYLGDLRCEATHGPSQTTLLTDAPVDNHGRGEAFSPTDLVATALGTCIVTTMGIFAQRHAIELRGTKITVQKEMTSVPTRRIARLACELSLPLPSTHPHREALERAAHTCPVHQSLHPDVDKPIRFIWAD
ncbi:MAG: OsmC family protein [Chthoniobacter sp.]|nr:OsmC family protein [Chthoniobacter sp.]